MAEAMMATVVLGIAAAGVLLPFTTGAKVRSEGMHRTLGAKLAGDFMEQIIVSDYNEIVDTYDGYTEAQGQVKDAAGTVYTDTNYANFSRDVSCISVYVPQEGGGAEPIFIRATVQVYYKGTEVTRVDRLISK